MENAGAHVPTHKLHTQCIQSLFCKESCTPLYLFIILSFLFSSLSFSSTGPLAAWPVFQIHSPGDPGPYKGGIPVPPGTVP